MRIIGKSRKRNSCGNARIEKAARIEGGKLMADKFGFVGETL